ncbi:MAG: hypothetical protein RLY93_20560 [Sumerlaeia bacterium]
MADRVSTHGLNISLEGPTTLVAGDVVEIDATANRTVKKLATLGSVTIVGRVLTPPRDGEVTVETAFKREANVTSGAAITRGAFVYDANGKAIQYDSASHDSAAIAGLILESAGAADASIAALLSV